MTHAHFLLMGDFKVNYIEGEHVNFGRWLRYQTKKEGIVMQKCLINFPGLNELLQKKLINFLEKTAKQIEMMLSQKEWLCCKSRGSASSSSHAHIST